jgi:hypothetical protein
MSKEKFRAQSLEAADQLKLKLQLSRAEGRGNRIHAAFVGGSSEQGTGELASAMGDDIFVIRTEILKTTEDWG